MHFYHGGEVNNLSKQSVLINKLPLRLFRHSCIGWRYEGCVSGGIIRGGDLQSVLSRLFKRVSPSLLVGETLSD